VLPELQQRVGLRQSSRPGRDRPPRGLRGAAAGRTYSLRATPDDASSLKAEV